MTLQHNHLGTGLIKESLQKPLKQQPGLQQHSYAARTAAQKPRSNLFALSKALGIDIRAYNKLASQLV